MPNIVTETDIKFIQNKFSGGMNLFGELSNLADNEYGPAFNVRNRTGALEPVKNKLIDSNAPRGLKQGILGFDNFIVIFVAGRAWYRERSSTTWTRIADFHMSETATRIYTQAVPASTIDNKRTLIDEGDNTTSQGNSLVNRVNLDPVVTLQGSNAGLICQDGENQPWIIFADGTARELQTYDEWNLDTEGNSYGREYVPIGKQMAFVDGILLLASADGKYLLRSVQGRPLDFVVNIGIDGDKGGDAFTTAYAVDYNPITCIKELNTGQIFIGTSFVSHVIEYNWDVTIFDQPTFRNIKNVNTGCLNQFSFIDITLLNASNPLSDYGIIDNNGLHSFNAALTDKNEGRNDIFSAGINNLFKRFNGITDQTQLILQEENSVCAINYDNLGLFATNTKYGRCIVVYDCTLQRWTSIDNLVSDAIIQFAIVSETETLKLFCITATDVIELYSQDSEGEATASVHLPEFTTQDASLECKISSVRAVFNHDIIDDTASVSILVNDCRKHTLSGRILSENAGIPYQVTYPVVFEVSTRTSNILFDFSQLSATGWRASAVITWQNNARLVHQQVEVEKVPYNVSLQQQAIVTD